MSQILKTRGSRASYGTNMNRNYYPFSWNGYGMQEKNELLNELAANLMEKIFEIDSYSVRRSEASWQMSK